MTWALNHLGYFLLTGRLLDLLGKAEGGRIVNVASRAHRGPQVDFDDPQGRTGYAGWRAYQQSKLANILFTGRLAERLAPAGRVTANCLHPGFVASRFGTTTRVCRDSSPPPPSVCSPSARRRARPRATISPRTNRWRA